MNAIKKLLPGLGYGLLIGGGWLFGIMQFVVTAIAGLSMIWWAITLFLEGSILWGLLVLLIGTPIAIAIASYAAIPLFFIGIIAAIIWGVIKLFGFDVSFDGVWDVIWVGIVILVLASIAFWVVSSLVRAIFKGEINWFRRHLNWTFVLAYVLWFVLNHYADDPFGIVGWLSLAAAVLWLVISGWVIKRKGRSLWWILLSWIGSPLWLKNKKSYREPTETPEQTLAI
jgi:hypothetical protein